MYFKKKKIFISYAREDYQLASEIHNFLKGIGHQVFIDMESIKAGERWKETTYKYMKKVDAVIPVISAHSLTKDGRIQFEFKQAIAQHDKRKVMIVPVRIDHTVGMAGFENFNIIDWDETGRFKLQESLDSINRRWLKVGIISLCSLAILITALVIWRKSNPIQSYSFNFSATVVDKKTKQPLAGVKILLHDEQGKMIAESAPSRTDGKVKLVTYTEDIANANVCFVRGGYAQWCGDFDIKRGIRQLKPVKTNIKIELVSMTRRAYQLGGSFNLTHSECEKIKAETGFDLSYNAPLRLNVSFDSSAVIQYGNDDSYLFTGNYIMIYANGRAEQTSIELNRIDTPMPYQLLSKRIDKNLTQTLRNYRSEIIEEIIRILQQHV